MTGSVHHLFFTYSLPGQPEDYAQKVSPSQFLSNFIVILNFWLCRTLLKIGVMKKNRKLDSILAIFGGNS